MEVFFFNTKLATVKRFFHGLLAGNVVRINTKAPLLLINEKRSEIKQGL